MRVLANDDRTTRWCACKASIVNILISHVRSIRSHYVGSKPFPGCEHPYDDMSSESDSSMCVVTFTDEEKHPHMHEVKCVG
jgi:hypothetical protein